MPVTNSRILAPIIATINVRIILSLQDELEEECNSPTPIWAGMDHVKIRG